eukprot:GILI01013828.1.p1 GENE.GILI01013828.1~~GILI01013828.1.p1  ORF type:complete len:221 (-),score=76.40 GILI01013828.1:490-1152(-)
MASPQEDVVKEVEKLDIHQEGEYDSSARKGSFMLVQVQEINKPSRKGSRKFVPLQEWESQNSADGKSDGSGSRGARRGGRGGFRSGRGGRGGRGGRFYGGDFYYPNYANFSESATPQEALQKQLEYYFSIQNLCKDMFLRMQMDQEGYVPIALLANFNRVRQLLAADSNLAIPEVLAESQEVEVSADKLKIRKKVDWKYWLLPAVPPAPAAEPAATSPSS